MEEAKIKLNLNSKLKMMSPMKSGSSCGRTYIDTVGVPWKKRSKVKKDLAKAQEILDSDHFGRKRSKNALSNT